MRKLLFILIIMLVFPVLLFSASYTSYASWYDANPTGDECFVSIYVLQNNTTIELYRVGTENTTIDYCA
jgi:hypothetical protein